MCILFRVISYLSGSVHVIEIRVIISQYLARSSGPRFGASLTGSWNFNPAPQNNLGVRLFYQPFWFAPDAVKLNRFLNDPATDESLFAVGNVEIKFGATGS